MNCSQCQHPLQAGAAFCDNCGTPAAPTPVSASAPTLMASSGAAHAHGAASGGANCPQCNSSVIPGEAFCGDCGSSLSAPQVAAPPPPVQSYQQPAASQSYQQSAAAQSYQQPAAAPVYQQPAAAPVYQQPAAAPVYQQPAAAPSYQQPAAAPSYQQPAAAPVYQQPAQQQPAAPAAGSSCATCGKSNTPGQAFCDNCGASIAATATPVAQPPGYPPPRANPAPAAVQPRLIVTSSGAQINFAPKPEILIGREDPVGGIFPEVDLTNHGGLTEGVSRKHAKITNQGHQWMIHDLNSVNFTFINKQRVTPGQPRPLNNGDEVRIGRVALTFQIA